MTISTSSQEKGKYFNYYQNLNLYEAKSYNISLPTTLIVELDSDLKLTAFWW